MPRESTIVSSAEIPPPLAPGAGVSQRFRMGRTVLALILREMSSRYGRSPGGYVWAVLEPVGMILIMAIGFSLLVRNPPLGTSFILFFATGFIPFNLYQALSNTIARTMIFSRALLSYPIITWVDAILARFILNSLTGIMVGYLVLMVFVQVSDSPILLNIRPILETMLLAMLLGLGVGTLNCALIGLIPVWDQVWSIFSRPLFLASGIILLYDDMPALARDILWYNPLVHVTGLMRTGFYPTYEATYVSVAFVIGFSLVSLFMGIVLMGRYHREILTN
ncbi:MAG: ABC transporter permease [Paracoccaceae bacterium]|nr:ABC transporter permease [Paracoccaceae bacterium]